ncbi:ATP-binding protein, partial [Streptomyces thermoalcalitolerans]
EDMPTKAEASKLFRQVLGVEATETLTRAVHQGDVQTQSAAVGDPASRSDISGLKAIQELIDILAIPAPIIYLFGNPGSGKTNFALLLAQLWKREQGDDAVLASNIRTWEEADEWHPSYGSLRSRLDDQTMDLPGGGITAKEDACPFLFVFDEASSHASGRGKDGYEAGQKLGPLVYKIRKARAGLIIIGHDGKDVHPAVRTMATVVQRYRGEVKRATVYEDVENRKGINKIMELNGIPETDYRYDDEEATSWSWDGVDDDGLEEQTLEQARELASDMTEQELRKVAWRLDSAGFLDLDQDDIARALGYSQQWVSKWSNRYEEQHGEFEPEVDDE